MFFKKPFGKSISMGFMSIALMVFTFAIYLLFKCYVHKSIITDIAFVALLFLFIASAALGIYGIKLALQFIKRDFWKALLSIIANALVPIYFIFSVIYVAVKSIFWT